MGKTSELIEKPLSGVWGEKDEIGNGIPVLRTTNFTDNGIIDYADVVTRSIDKRKVADKFLRKGDIIIEKSGGASNKPVGRVVYFEGEENRYLFNNFTSVLRVNNPICNSKYLFYILYFKYKRGYTWAFQNKTTGIANLKLQELITETEVIIPSMKEQRRRVRSLDKTQEIIDGHKKQLAELDDLIKAVFYEMFGDPVANDKGLEVAKIKDFFIVRSGSTPKRNCNEYWENGSIPWIKTTEIKENCINSSEEYITELAAKECRLTRMPKGTILVAMYGQGQTRGRTAKLMVNATINQACAALLKKENNINVDFVWHLLMLSYEQLRSLGRGGNQPNLNKSLVENFEILIPAIDLQNKFANIVTKIEEEKALVKRAITESEHLFNSLMSEYFD